MLMQQERELVVEYGKKMITSGLTKGTSGNISIFNPDLKLMVISPSGLDYFQTTAEDVVVMDLDGNIVESERKPSSEHGLHSIFYKTRDDVRAVVHTHSMYCTAFASCNKPLEAVHYVIGVAGTPKVPCAKYATYGTDELAHNVIEACGKGNAVLLANHGIVTCGPTIGKAFSIADNMEYIAEVQYRANVLGNPAILSDEEMERVMIKFKSHGQVKKTDDKSDRVY